MRYNDHGPAHFHAEYRDNVVGITIEDGRILSGEFPRRARGLVLEWLESPRNELQKDWLLDKQGKPLMKIAPLE